MRLISTQALCLSLVIGLLLPSVATALVLRVPGKFETVQGAIDAAEEGDVILIAPGTYQEPLNLKGGISILGTGNDSRDTVLSGGYQFKVASLINDGRLLQIENLSFEDGYSGSGGGLLIDEGCRVILDRVTFYGNGTDGDGGALYVKNSQIEMYNCFFYANFALGGGGGSVHIEGSHPQGYTQIIQNCTFAASAGCCGATSIVLVECTTEMNNTILEDITCGPGAFLTMHCNNGGWCGIDAGGNILEDPRYCNFERADCHLESDSPCLPENNPECGLVGAFGECFNPTPTEASSFSSVKSLFR